MPAHSLKRPLNDTAPIVTPIPDAYSGHRDYSDRLKDRLIVDHSDRSIALIQVITIVRRAFEAVFAPTPLSMRTRRRLPLHALPARSAPRFPALIFLTLT